MTFTRNGTTLSSRDVPDIRSGYCSGRPKKASRDNAKECAACSEIVSLSATACDACGFVFPVVAPLIDMQASNLDVLTRTDSKRFDVRRVTYRLHEKPGGKPSLRVQYEVGLFWPISDFKSFESPAARPWVEKWWTQTGGNLPVPATAYEALGRTRELREPVEIKAREDGKFWKITRRKFERGQEAA